MKKIRLSPSIPDEFFVDQVSENEANIILKPFEAGNAISVAHPIRRFLLNSTVGYAPIAIKIEGIKHEFEYIKGILEDVSEFILNLKQVRFKIVDTSKSFVEISYSFQNRKEITAYDLKNDVLDVVSDDTHILTLNGDATLDFSLIVYKGIGYVPSEDLRSKELEDYILFDAFFTPVKKAIYNIESTLVKGDLDYEQITFNIVTDGQVTPEEALRNAVNNMYAQLTIFNCDKVVNINEINGNKEEEFNEELKKLMISIDKLAFSVRSYNCLEKADIKYFGDIVSMSEKEIRCIKNLGKKSFDEIVDKVNELGFKIGVQLPHKLVEYFEESKDKEA